MPSNIDIDGNAYEIADPYLLNLDANLIGQQNAKLSVRTTSPQQDIDFVTALEVHGGEGDLSVVLKGPAGWSTFAFSVAAGGGGGEFTDVPDGPWPRSSLPTGDICSTVIPPGYQSRLKVTLVSADGNDTRYIDPIIQNGHSVVGGVHR